MGTSAAGRGVMSYLTEVGDLVLLAARAQGIPYNRVRRCWHASTTRRRRTGYLVRGMGAGSRPHGRIRTSPRCLRLYNLARFPYPDSPARRGPLTLCVLFRTVGDPAAGDRRGIARMELTLLGQRVRCGVGSRWDATAPATAGHGRHRERERAMGAVHRWHADWAWRWSSRNAGVGENPLRYDRESWRMLPACSTKSARSPGAGGVRHRLEASAGTSHCALRA